MAAMAPSTLTGSGTLELLAPRLERTFGGADQPDVLAFELELERHLEQPRRARIARVKAVAESRRHLPFAARTRRRSCRPLPAATCRRAPASGPRRETACTTRCRRRGAGRTPRMPAATQSLSGAPDVATLRAASVDGGVTP